MDDGHDAAVYNRCWRVRDVVRLHAQIQNPDHWPGGVAGIRILADEMSAPFHLSRSDLRRTVCEIAFY
jgi:hypothetical protein